MPLVTITMLESVSAPDQRAIADSIHQAIVKAGFPEADRFQRILKLGTERFIFDRTHPDLSVPRSERFVLIEILLSAGRTVDFKKDLLAAIVENLGQRPGLAPHDVMGVFIETARENWAFASGIQTYIEASAQS
jgi:phenylpyruvate tautomerase PptA (4-oxalocrotonate tautomerase family)